MSTGGSDPQLSSGHACALFFHLEVLYVLFSATILFVDHRVRSVAATNACSPANINYIDVDGFNDAAIILTDPSRRLPRPLHPVTNHIATSAVSDRYAIERAVQFSPMVSGSTLRIESVSSETPRRLRLFRLVGR